MGNLPIHIYGYINEHDVIVYMVIKDTQKECGQPHHLRFSPFTLKLNPAKWGVQCFQKSQFSRVENNGVVETTGVTVVKVNAF